MLIAFFAIIYKPLNLQRPFQKSEVRDSECLVYEGGSCIITPCTNGIHPISAHLPRL